VPKVIPSKNSLRNRELFFSDNRWSRIRTHIPEPLSAESDARLRITITKCCSWLLTEQRRLREGAAFAAAMRKPGNRQLAPLERLAKALRTAVEVWEKIRNIPIGADGAQRHPPLSQSQVGGARAAWIAAGHDVSKFDDAARSDGFDPTSRNGDIDSTRADGSSERSMTEWQLGNFPDAFIGDHSRYRELVAMAKDAERCLDSICALGKPITATAPWRVFVGKVAQCCREAGLNPTATGRVYERGEPTWFQDFMRALNDQLLGDRGKGKQLHSSVAFHAEITKAMRGDRKPGKARK
jgi:hypothetical protein